MSPDTKVKVLIDNDYFQTRKVFEDKKDLFSDSLFDFLGNSKNLLFFQNHLQPWNTRMLLRFNRRDTNL